jgi:hypothetical protein
MVTATSSLGAADDTWMPVARTANKEEESRRERTVP